MRRSSVHSPGIDRFGVVLRQKGHRLVAEPEKSTRPPSSNRSSTAYGGPLTGTFEGERTWREGVRLRLDWQLDNTSGYCSSSHGRSSTPLPRPAEEERQPRSRFAPPNATAAWVKGGG